MQEVDACNGLNEKVESCVFSKAALFLDKDKQVALRHILHDQVDVLSILQIGIHAHNVDMLQLFMNFNFSSKCLLHLGRFDHALVQLFNSHFLARRFVKGQLDLAVGALAKSLVLKDQLVKSHVCKGGFVGVSLASDTQLASLHKWCRFLDAAYLGWIESADNLAAECVFASRALVLMPQLPVLIEAVMRAVNQ